MAKSEGKDEVTFFEKKVTKKTFAGGVATPVSLSRPVGGDKATAEPQSHQQKFFAELFFKKATS
jgi:hypothetical protein